jgi:hypothetical protein
LDHRASIIRSMVGVDRAVVSACDEALAEVCRGMEVLDSTVLRVTLETQSGVNTGQKFSGLAFSACSGVLAEAHRGVEVSDILGKTLAEWWYVI